VFCFYYSRTPGTGLYDNLQQYKIPFAEAIFDIDYFCENPRPFCTLAQELFPTGKYQPNIVHYFLRLLHCKGLLSRVYTQNIDGLERRKDFFLFSEFLMSTLKLAGLIAQSYRVGSVPSYIDLV
jgi:NAD-dependent SIR2 family protein deacetylase